MKICFEEADYIEYADQVAGLATLTGMPCNGKISPKVVDCVLFTISIDDSKMVLTPNTDEPAIVIPLETMMSYCPNCGRFEISMYHLKYIPEVVDSVVVTKWLEIGAVTRQIFEMLRAESFSMFTLDDTDEETEQLPGVNQLVQYMETRLLQRAISQ